MRQILISLFLAFGLSGSAFGQEYQANITLTIDNTSGGVAFTSTDITGPGHPQVTSAACTSNSSGGTFRYRVDGTAPTTSVGVEVPAGGAIVFTDTQALLGFKGIRTGGTSAVLNCTFTGGPGETPGVVPVGAGGGGGSSSGNAAASATGAAVPSSADYVGFNSGGNLVGVDTTNRLPVTCDNCGGGSGGTSANDNSAFTFGTTSLTPNGYVFDDTSPNTVTENRVATPRMSSLRVPYAQIRDAAGNERGANVNASNQLSVTGPVTLASAAVASGAYASGSIASGAIASGAVASGAFASGSIGSGAIASGAIAAGAFATGATSVAADEDSGAASGDRGLKGLVAIQTATPADTGAEADYSFLQMSVGRLWTNTIGSLAANGAAAATNRMGVLPAIVETGSLPTLTDGRDSALYTNTNGALFVTPTSGSFATDATHDSAASATGPQIMGVAAADGSLPSAVTAGDAVRLAADLQGIQYVRMLDPCSALPNITLPVSVAADTAVITATASKRTIICSGAIVASGAEVFNLWEGTGSACGTSSAALVGSTTEANGMSFAANGGFTISAPIRGLSTNVDVCVRLSGTTRVAGYLVYVQAP